MQEYQDLKPQIQQQGFIQTEIPHFLQNSICRRILLLSKLSIQNINSRQINIEINVSMLNPHTCTPFPYWLPYVF